MFDLKPSPGTYALTLFMPERTRFAQVGPFGAMTVPQGLYVYVGSARGSGGIRARIGKHLKALKGKSGVHVQPSGIATIWHLHYVLPAMQVLGAWVTYHDRTERRECQWSRLIHQGLHGHPLFAGMGSGDCKGRQRCLAHFYFFARPRTVEQFREVALVSDPDHPPIEVVDFTDPATGVDTLGVECPLKGRTRR